MKRHKPLSHRSIWAIGLLVVAVLVSFTNWNTTSATDDKKKSIGSATLRPQEPTKPVQEGGEWSTLYGTAQVPVHISLLPDGRLLYWGRDKHADGWDIGGRSSTYLIDPLYIDDSRYTTVIDPPEALQTMLTTNLFCSGHSFLPDGRLLVAGGHKRDDNFPSKEGIGEDTINIFDYRTNLWILSGHMDKGRWYPYNVTLANGETLIASGTYVNGTSAPIANDEPTIRKLDGSLQTLHPDGNFEVEFQHPYLSLTPNNKVFSARKTGSKNGLTGSHLLDPNAIRPTDNQPGVAEVLQPGPADAHKQGSAVQYAPGKVMLVGGTATDRLGDAKSKKAEIINLNSPVPIWSPTADLSTERLLPNATLLPDGQILVTGGTNCERYNNVACGSIQTPELWNPDPAFQTWSTMNPSPNNEPRVYHSIAMLMPDARVMVGGGGLPAANGEIVGTSICDNSSLSTMTAECRKFGHRTVDFFSPPYLFDATGQPAVRPAIASAPESISYGQQFSINVGNVSPAEIKEVVLVRLPSVTHTFNQDQRRVVLGAPVSINGFNITVNAPANGNVCPPGPYMLFLISNNGRKTPSIAKIVRVGDLSIDSSTSFFNSGQSFAPTSPSLTGTVTVRALPGVSWFAQVVSPNTWLTLQNSTGTGNGTVNFTVAPNVGSANNTVPPRSAVIRISIFQRDAIGVDYRVYQAGNFIDTPDGSVFYPSASKIYARGVTNGCTLPPTNFCPDTTITRGQGAVFISNLLHPGSLPTPLAQRFADVPINNAFARSVEYVARRKIIDTSSSFGVDQPLTRKDAIIWLLRAVGITNPPKTMTSSFFDVSKDDPASPFIEEAFRRGITSGCGAGNFCPNTAATRGQMSVFVAQTFKL